MPASESFRRDPGPNPAGQQTHDRIGFSRLSRRAQWLDAPDGLLGSEPLWPLPLFSTAMYSERFAADSQRE